MTEEQLKQRKETLVSLFNDPAYVPMKQKELAVLLDIPREQREELKEVLDSLVGEGKAGISKKGKYGKAELFARIGIFSGHPRGFGFVTIEGMESDIFIPKEQVHGALHGDKVQIVIEEERDRGGRRPEGTVLKIVEHANQTLIGYYQKNKGFGFVSPDNQKIGTDVFIPQGKDMGAVTGHKVVVRVTDFGNNRQKPEGVVTEIIGHVNDPGTDILSIIKAYGLPEGFADSVMNQVARIPDEVTEKEMAGRKDLRNWKTVTIDGEDAKDLDDAITVERTANGYILGVHIADVTNYVTEGSPLDEEALKRGTSVYLVDRVIPMLPHKLSNGICSLNAGTDRLALSCIMEIDEKGAVLGHEIAQTVVNVDQRMTYTAVDAIVTRKDPETMEEYHDFVEMFDLMKELADLLRQRRRNRGSIDFDFPESKIILDGQGHPIEIRPYERNAATKIIEDFMLLANETVAEDYFWQELPFLYRTHDIPDPEKMRGLATFINNFGYTMKSQHGEVHPKELQKLLTNIEGTTEEALISRLTLRSMKQAKYLPVCAGHFGLAAKYYTHFTSPIRRYPDLQIHRIIKANITGGLSEKQIRHYEAILPQVANQCSMRERLAEEAERETDKLKKCEYMSKRIGESFEGVISGVTNWGFYVELPSTVEGLVHVNELRGDYYAFDNERLELRGELTGKTFKLGQKLYVTVTGVDRLSRTIDFAPCEEMEEE